VATKLKRVMMSAIPQLLLVKYLFQRGQDTFAEKGPYSAGLSVSLFQDAIELMVRTIAKEVDAKVSDNTGFDTLWDAVRSALKNVGRKELPLKAKVLDLNKARVGFKHYGNLPADADAAKFAGYAEQFLVAACNEFFGLSFYDISLVDLIQHKVAQEHLRAAERAVAANDAASALEECAKAFHYLGKPLAVLIPRLGDNFSSVIASADARGRNIQRAAREVEDNVAGLRDFVVATSVGVPLLDYFHLRLVIPGVLRLGDGKFQVQWFGGKQAELENAQFALKFVTDYGIAVQKLTGKLTEMDRKLLFGEDA